MSKGKARNKEIIQMNRPAKPIHKRVLLGAISTCIVLLATLGVSSASADYGLSNFDMAFSNENGTPATQAGSHPFALESSFEVNSQEQGFEFIPDGEIKDLIVQNVEGLAGDATAVPRCSTASFVSEEKEDYKPDCPDNTAVGVAGADLFGPPPFLWSPGAVFNLIPAPGVPVRLGFSILGVRITVDVGVKRGGRLQRPRRHA